MLRLRLRIRAISPLVVLLLIGCGIAASAQKPPDPLEARVTSLEARVAVLEGTGQRLLVPAYFPPGADWDRLTATARRGDIAIMNVDRGPGGAQDAWQRTYAAQMVRSQAAGLVVIGYVLSGFGNRPLADVYRDVDRWYAWSTPDGIFVDEGWQFPDKADYYQQVHAYIKAKAGRGRLVVLNLGAYPQYEGIMQRADIANLVEQTCAWYGSGAYAMPGWVGTYPPNRIAHLLYDCPGTGQPLAAVALARQRGVGSLYVTNLAPPADVWGALPPPAYWSAELAAMRAP